MNNLMVVQVLLLNLPAAKYASASETVPIFRTVTTLLIGTTATWLLIDTCTIILQAQGFINSGGGVYMRAISNGSNGKATRSGNCVHSLLRGHLCLVLLSCFFRFVATMLNVGWVLKLEN